MKIDKIRNSLKVANIGNVLKSEQLRINTTFIFNYLGEGFYLKDGKEIPESQFDLLHPIERLQKTSYKGKNSDRRKRWMNDEKSY